MKEVFIISKIPNGYFCGIDYDINEASYCTSLIDSSPQLFDTVFLAEKKLYDLKNECKQMNGLYEIIKLIIIE